MTTDPADYPIGTVLRDPKTCRLAVRLQVDDASGKGMHAWFVPVPDGEARILHHVEVSGWQPVELPQGVADVVQTALERQAAEVARHTRERDEAQRAVEQELKNRDEAVEWADELALAIAPVEVIGEHTSANEPWRNALEIAESRPAIPADAEEQFYNAILDVRSSNSSTVGFAKACAAVARSWSDLVSGSDARADATEVSLPMWKSACLDRNPNGSQECHLAKGHEGSHEGGHSMLGLAEWLPVSSGGDTTGDGDYVSPERKWPWFDGFHEKETKLRLPASGVVLGPMDPSDIAGDTTGDGGGK